MSVDNIVPPAPIGSSLAPEASGASAKSVGTPYSINSNTKRTESVKDRTKKLQLLAEEADRKRAKQKRQRRKAWWISAKSEEELMAERFGANSWRCRVVSLLQGKNIQLMFTAMLVLDVLIVLTEVFVDAEFPACARIKRDAISCGLTTAARRLGGGGGDICEAPLQPVPEYAAGCDGDKYPAVHSLHDVCFVMTICILGTFELELLVLFVAMLEVFTKNLLYLVDLFVVTVSLVLELYMRLGTRGGEAAALMLIVARCWRFVRIAHGIMSSSHERDMEVIEEITSGAKELYEDVLELEKEVREMEKKLAQYESIYVTPGESASSI